MRSLVAWFFLLAPFLPNLAFSQGTLLIFSGDLRGEIKPCGCSAEGDLGGLLRRATFLQASLTQQRSGNSELFYFDLGNNFPEPSGQGKLKIRLIQTALRKSRPEAVLVGPNEWLNGLHSLNSEVPYLLSNQNGSLPFLTSKIMQFASAQNSKNPEQLILSGYLSPNLIYQNQNEALAVLPVNSELLANWKKQFRQKTAFRILLFRGNAEELEKFEQSGIFGLIVVGSTNNDENNQILEMQTQSGSFPMIPTKGQGILSGKLTTQGNKIVSSDLTVTWLGEKFTDAAELSGDFRTYDEAVKDLFFSNLERMERQRRESPFVGDVVCESCHKSSFAIWKKSRHARAFATLESKGKHFDPECLECHVVGLKAWQAPLEVSESMQKFSGRTGFFSLQFTPHLTNVQCENCHGPAREHLENNKIPPTTAKPESSCAGCHHGSHSPKFDFGEYWRKIEH